MNINDIYFDGKYREIWKLINPPKLAIKEVQFLIDYFKLATDDIVLDFMCGYGRHSVLLAREGINVTALDNSEAYLTEVEAYKQAEQLPIEVVKADAAEFKLTRKADLVICLGNSLSFFPPDTLKQILENLNLSLRDGGFFVINTWSIAEIAFLQHKSKSWSYVGEFRFIAESDVRFGPTRIESKHLILDRNGSREEKLAIDYIYSLNEIEMYLTAAGFELIENFSIPQQKSFCIGDNQAYIIAKKVSEPKHKGIFK